MILSFFLFTAQALGSQTESAQPALSGRWILTADYLGTPTYMRLQLEQQGDKLAGQFGSRKLVGSISGNAIHFTTKDEEGDTEEVSGSIHEGRLSGSVVEVNAGHAATPVEYRFTAVRTPPRSNLPPERHEFAPTVFYRQFSALNKPVLTVAPGDTIHTTTVDAGGTDAAGAKRAMGGNPQTGPFYVETALPGDTLAVHLIRLRLNRDWAESDDGMVGRSLRSDLSVRMKDVGKAVRWHLDLEKGVATSERPGEHLAPYTVPLRPMLGCIAVAPSPSQAAPPTSDSGSWGGNIDFNEIVDGVTVYLPVRNPGALLYVGDGHAAQGDGELNGNALETSMDVEFSVDVFPGQSVPGVRVESPTHLMAMGLAGSLDDSFREATDNMAQWLTEAYKLTPSEIAQVLGTSAEYQVSEVADRNAGIVLKLRKERLQPLTKAR